MIKQQFNSVIDAIEQLKINAKSYRRGRYLAIKRFYECRDFLVQYYAYVLKDVLRVYEHSDQYEDLLQEGYLWLVRLVETFAEKRSKDLEGYLLSRLPNLLEPEEEKLLSLDAFDDEILSDEEDLDEIVWEKWVKENMSFIIEKLSAKEECFVRMRFGFAKDGNPLFLKPHTLRECAAYFKITPEGMRLREVKILRKIKSFIDDVEEEDEEVKVNKPLKDEGKTLIEIMNCSYEELLACLFCCDEKSRRYKILMECYGDDFRNGQLIQNWSKEKRKILYEAKKILRNELKKLRDMEGKTLQEILKLNDEEFFRLLIFIDLDSSWYQDLVRFHGSFLEERFTLDGKNIEEINLYQKAFLRIKKYIKRLKMPFLGDLFCIGKYKYSIVSFVQENDDIYAIMAKVYGDDLDRKEDLSQLSEEEIYKYYYYLYQIKCFFVSKKYKNKESARYSCENVGSWDTSYNPFWMEVVHFLPVSYQEKEILARRLGFFDGKIYSISELVDLYGMDEQALRNGLDNLLRLFYSYCQDYSLESDGYLRVRG